MSDKIESPRGKYSIKIDSIETKPGCWNYTKATVFSKAGYVVTEVHRNYSSFPYLFVEDHPNGHDYLVCGEDYQGQTVIELDTGLSRPFLPEEAKNGHGFCWIEYTYNEKSQLLLVDGCVWACPYEFRVYEFSDPMNRGWPRVKLYRTGEKGEEEETYADVGHKKPEIENDAITFYETREIEEYEGDDEGEGISFVTVASQTYKLSTREGQQVLVLAGEWIDQAERERREEHQRRQKEWDRKWKEYKETNPLYLSIMDLSSRLTFTPPKYRVSTGVCYEGWHPSEKFDDTRVCLDLLREKERSARLEWGRVSAPIKLCYRLSSSQKEQVLWFSREDIEGLENKIRELFLSSPSMWSSLMKKLRSFL